jgi:tetratricopeptide (TPR) repeat protein
MRFILLILLLFVSTHIFGQNDTEQKFFYRAYDNFVDGHYSIAKKEATIFLKLYPQSRHSRFLVKALGDIAYKEHKIDTAIYLYLQVISASDDTDQRIIGRYNLKNEACKSLADISIAQKRYSVALQYLEMANHKYYYSSTCGNAYEWNNIDMALRYATCYTGLKEYKKAIGALSSFMFYYDSKLPKILYKTYLTIYRKEQVKEEFMKALKTLVVLKKESNIDPIIVVFGDSVHVEPYWRDYGVINSQLQEMNEKQQRKEIISDIKNSQIYKLAISN